MADQSLYQKTEATTMADADVLWKQQDIAIAPVDRRITWANIKKYFLIHALAAATNDFLVASGAGVFVKKTLAETLTILGKAAASGLASLNASSLVVQNPANATAIPTASKIPIADADGKLNAWVTALTTTAKARAYRSTAYTPGANGHVKVPLDAENYDPGSNFDSVTNNRFVAPVTGYYAVTGTFSIDVAVAGDTFFALLYVDGVQYSRGNRSVVNAGGNAFVVTDIVYMVASSYVELWAYCSTARPFEPLSKTTYLSVHLLST
uniref:C1q domain-containing protein n=1 Tax=viral metagenome TaxID=1070528 RepID=A0A6H1Z9E1_9ZZZZ